VNAPAALAFTAALIGLTAPAYAQSPVPATNTVRIQVRTMENVFMTAVAGGVQQIAQKIQIAVPGLTVVSGVPRAHGYAVEGHGWFFDVEVPELRWATIDLYYDVQRAPSAQPPISRQGTRLAFYWTERPRMERFLAASELQLLIEALRNDGYEVSLERRKIYAALPDADLRAVALHEADAAIRQGRGALRPAQPFREQLVVLRHVASLLCRDAYLTAPAVMPRTM